jgi:glutamate-1-semialdehyde 2,1-aminomutase
MYENSVELHKVARGLIPGGCSTESKKPDALFASENSPAYYKRAKGAKIYDMDQNEFIDFGMALGACLLGYSHPVIEDAIKGEAGNGILTTLPTYLEPQLAELIIDSVPSIELVRFMKTGAEAVSAAVRLARAYTGRKYVLASGYFGWHDWFSRGEGVPESIKDLCVLFTFNDTKDFLDKLDAFPEHPAAVVMEPVINEHPKQEFLELIRETCDKFGIVLIWDETKTALRMTPGGAQQFYNFNPDLTVMGKALAGGMSLAAIGGKKAFMESWHRVWISSTYACESLSLSTAIAVLNFARENPVHTYIQKLGTQLLEGAQEISAFFPDVLEVYGIPQMIGIRLKGELPDIQEKEASFYRSLLDFGFIIKRRGYNFVCYSHTEEHIDGCLNALKETLRKNFRQSSP